VQNNTRVQWTKRQLVEYAYRGQDDLPSGKIQALIESSIVEIQRLQRELDSANRKIQELKSTDTVTKKDGE
jgi:hypothetical protein